MRVSIVSAALFLALVVPSFALAGPNDTYYAAIRDSSGAVSRYTVVELAGDGTFRESSVPASAIRLGETTSDGRYRQAYDAAGNFVGYYSLNVSSQEPSNGTSPSTRSQSRTTPGGSGGNSSFFGPIVPPCTEYSSSATICQACNLVQLADNLLRFFVSLAVMASALMFAYAGFLYVTAAANQSNLESAKKIFSNVFIGLIFVLLAFLIVDLVLRVFTQQSFNVLSRIQCVRQEGSGIQITFPNTPSNNPVSGSQGGEPAPGGSTFNAPAGSCIAVSQSVLDSGAQATPNCNPAARVQSYGDVSCTANAARIRQNWGTVIDHCAQQSGIPPSVLVAISRVECSGAATCTDPTGVGQGATGVSVSEVKTYCSGAGRSTTECAGVSGLTDTQLRQRISSSQQLSFCATASTMKRNRDQYGNWSTAAVAYNGGGEGTAADPGPLFPSRDCPGLLAYQCPISRGNSQYPYCHVTCAYQDIFDTCVRAAGGL